MLIRYSLVNLVLAGGVFAGAGLLLPRPRVRYAGTAARIVLLSTLFATHGISSPVHLGCGSTLCILA